MIGTTHFTNAVVQRRDLDPVAAVRIGLPSGRSLPPFVDWPEDLAALVRGGVFMVEGGHECDGRPLVPFDEAATPGGRGTDPRPGHHVGGGERGVLAAHAPCEEAAAAILRDAIPGVSVTLSHDLGRLGLLERENAALLNASLVALARRTTAGVHRRVAGERHRTRPCT